MRAAIYVRVSSRGQEQDGTSLQTQEDRCRTYCAEHGYEVVNFYREVHTGVELWERPELTALRTSMKQKAVDVIVAYAIDRLARDQAHLGLILTEAAHYGIAAEFVTEQLDDSPQGQLLRSVMGFVGQIEHIKLKERTLRGRKARVQNGKPWPGSRPPFGYQWSDDKKSALIPNPEMAPIIQRIFAMALDNTPTRRIARILTEEQTPTPTGLTVWRMGTVYNILVHPYYGGRPTGWRHTEERRPDGTHLHIKRQVEDQITLSTDLVPPLVPTSTWDYVQEQLARNKLQAARSNKHPESALLRGGMAVCGYCGRTLQVGSNNHKPSYRCRGEDGLPGSCRMPSIQCAMLDAEVWSIIEEWRKRPEVFLDKVRQALNAPPPSDDVSAIERRLTAIIRKQQNAAKRITLIDDEEVAAPLLLELKSLAEQKRKLEAELDLKQKQARTWRSTVVYVEELAQWITGGAGPFPLTQWVEDDPESALDALGDDFIEVARTTWQRVSPKAELTYEAKRTLLNRLGVVIRVYQAKDADHPRWELETALDVERLVTSGSSTASHKLTLRWPAADLIAAD